MARFPPTDIDRSPTNDEPHVVQVGAESKGEGVGALSSATARALLTACQSTPSTASELADAVDTSVQNAHYHLDRLEGAGLVEVVDTAYSPKGREMAVYEATGSPTVFVAGGEADREAVVDLLTRFLGGLGLVTVAALATQHLLGGVPPSPSPDAGGTGTGGIPVGIVVFVVGLGALLLATLASRRTQA